MIQTERLDQHQTTLIVVVVVVIVIERQKLSNNGKRRPFQVIAHNGIDINHKNIIVTVVAGGATTTRDGGRQGKECSAPVIQSTDFVKPSTLGKEIQVISGPSHGTRSTLITTIFVGGTIGLFLGKFSHGIHQHGAASFGCRNGFAKGRRNVSQLRSQFGHRISRLDERLHGMNEFFGRRTGNPDWFRIRILLDLR